MLSCSISGAMGDGFGQAAFWDGGCSTLMPSANLTPGTTLDKRFSPFSFRRDVCTARTSSNSNTGCLKVVDTFRPDIEFIRNPVMEQLRQGQGIIDMVNVYLTVALSSGYVGLFLYMGIFASAVVPIWNSITRIRPLYPELELIGRALLSAIIAMMTIIATVSSYNSIPYFIWILVGLAIAYRRLCSEAVASVGGQVVQHETQWAGSRIAAR